MDTHDLDTLCCRFIDHVINHQRVNHLDQFLAAEVIEHAPAAAVANEAAQRRLARWPAAFPTCTGPSRTWWSRATA